MQVVGPPGLIAPTSIRLPASFETHPSDVITLHQEALIASNEARSRAMDVEIATLVSNHEFLAKASNLVHSTALASNQLHSSSNCDLTTSDDLICWNCLPNVDDPTAVIPILSLDERLKLEACSAAHQMNHKPKNKFCPTCIRVKLYASQARRKDPDVKTEPKRSGDLVL